MADITDPKAKRHAADFRKVAEAALSVYRTIEQFQAKVVEFETITQQNLDGDIIGDDTRDPIYPVTKLNVAQLKDVFLGLEAAYEESDRLARLRRWTANSLPLY